MTGTPPPQKIPLDKLRADERYQPRLTGIDEKHVKLLLASDPETWPPLLVAPNDDGGYNILDGFHRHEAAQRLGVQELPCIVQHGAGYPEAFAANLRHGLPLSLEDRKLYARWLHKQAPELSYREIGRRVNLNHETVKAAIERGENRHAQNATHVEADPLEKLRRIQGLDPLEGIIDLAYATITDTTGVSKLKQFFGKNDRRQRAEYVRREIAQYEEDVQPELAAALHTVALAFFDASQPFIKTTA